MGSPVLFKVVKLAKSLGALSAFEWFLAGVGHLVHATVALLCEPLRAMRALERFLAIVCTKMEFQMA